MFHISWNILCAQPVYRDSLTDNHFFLQKLLSYATIHSPQIIDVNHEVFYAVVKNKSQIFLLGPDDFLISILSDEEYHRNIQKNFGTIILDNLETHTQHNSYAQEIREMDNIRSGDIERLKQSWQEDYLGSFGILAPTRLRTYQNLGIVITVLASRAAIEGGVHPEIAFSLVDSYCQKVEASNDATVAGELGRQAEMQFTIMVRKIRERVK